MALSQIDNVSPNLGQGYIIDSFMVVVFGGVGNLWGTAFGALLIGLANKLLEPLIGAVQGQIVLLIFIILFIQRRPRGLFALRGPRGGSMSARLDQLGFGFVAILIAAAILVPVLSLGDIGRTPRSICRPISCSCSANIFATRSSPSRSISSGAIAAFCRSAMARSSRSAAMRWACI